MNTDTFIKYEFEIASFAKHFFDGKTIELKKGSLGKHDKCIL